MYADYSDYYHYINMNAPSDDSQTITQEQDARFRTFATSLEFMVIRLAAPLSIPKQNAQLLKGGFTAQEIELFRIWQRQEREGKKREEEMSSRPWLPEELGAMIDGLSVRTTPQQLAGIEKQLENRICQRILLGTCNNWNVRLCLNVFELDTTWTSLEAKSNDEHHESKKSGDTRSEVPLLRSLYRNQDDDDEDVQAAYYSHSGSENLEHPGELKQQIVFLPTEDTAKFVSRVLRLDRKLDTKKLVIETASSPNKYELIAFEGRNRLKTFLPLGVIEVHRSEHNNYPVWNRTQFHLVVNMYDKRPWIVLNPRIVNEHGGDDMYLYPGQRLGTFCGSTNLRSHARLGFSASETGSANVYRMDHATDHRRRDQREATPLPSDFWQQLFAGWGTLHRKIEAQPFFQDPNFSIGYAVWDDKERRTYRQHDTHHLENRAKEVDDYAHSFQLEKSPPNPNWIHVREGTLHHNDDVKKAIAQFIFLFQQLHHASSQPVPTEIN